MRREIVEKELREVLASRMPGGVDPAALRMDVPIFRGGFGLDSISGLELVVEIERRFEIRIEDDDLDVFDSLDRLVDFVAARASGRQ